MHNHMKFGYQMVEWLKTLSREFLDTDTNYIKIDIPPIPIMGDKNAITWYDW